MNKKWKRTLGVVMATVSLGSAIAFAGCGGVYTGDKLDGYVSEAEVSSNGGFAVEKGDFVYFINGIEDYTEPNVYGEVVKGALMRIKKADLSIGDYAKAETVVPMLFAAQNSDAGIYIYGDYVYYATPTTDKNMDGEVESSWIDFKRAKLDGSETMKDYYFRLSSNSSTYRFVQEGDTVYCLYEEDGYLKSYDTKDKESRVLASADSYYYDTSDPTNANVYYTMSVTVGADTDNPTTASYNQLYCVNAAARVESVGEKNGVASYKVKGGKEYKFDAEYLKEKSDEAVKNGGEATFDANDYTTYPYVNLGELVLDGIGSNALNETQFNGKKADALTPDGYTYTVKQYANGGVYFTRTEVAKTSSDAESTKLYYLAEADKNASAWNVVSGNGSSALDVVALDSTVVGSALLTMTTTGAHEYYYVANTTLYKVKVEENGVATEIQMARNVSGASLWKVEGEFLYYYQTSEAGNGNSLSRIRVTGSKENYNTLLEEVAYQPITLAGVQFNSSWYKPEIFGNTVLFANEQSFGSVTYNYIYAAKLPATQAEIKAINEQYEAVQEAIDEYSDNSDLQELMKYYFRTGETEKYDAVQSLYDETEQGYFEEFKNKFGTAADKLKLESYFFDRVGTMKEADKESIGEAWANSLRSEEETEEEEGLPGWAIALIVVGSVLVVLAATLIPTLIVLSKKKAKAKAAEETVNAYKRKKIDTTDDKSIDVYADEEGEATLEEEAQEPAKKACCHCDSCENVAEETPEQEEE